MNTQSKWAWGVIGIIVIALIVVILIAVFGGKKDISLADIDSNRANLCYYSSTKTARGLSDVSWVKINVDGQNASGELRILPAEKDSKVGTYSGTVSGFDQSTKARTVDAWWNASAEGMTVREELRIIFGEGAAYVGFGEMVDQGNNTYGYKDKTNLTYSTKMSQVSCSDLNERVTVEEYVKTNIGNISPEKPVVGGSWYVTALSVDPLSNTGHVEYEDGHIAEESEFGYAYDGTTVTAVELFDTK